MQVVVGGVGHAPVDPVDAHAEELAFHEADHDLTVALADQVAGEGGGDIGGHRVVAQPQHALGEHVPVHRVVDVHDGTLVLQGELKRHVEALVQGRDGGVSLNELLRLLGDDLAQQGGDVVKVVVEGIAVDAAVLHNVTHADLVQGLLVQQLQKRGLDRLLRKVRHSVLRFGSIWSISQVLLLRNLRRR